MVWRDGKKKQGCQVWAARQAQVLVSELWWVQQRQWGKPTLHSGPNQTFEGFVKATQRYRYSTGAMLTCSWFDSAEDTYSYISTCVLPESHSSIGSWAMAQTFSNRWGILLPFQSIVSKGKWFHNGQFAENSDLEIFLVSELAEKNLGVGMCVHGGTASNSSARVLATDLLCFSIDRLSKHLVSISIICNYNFQGLLKIVKQLPVIPVKIKGFLWFLLRLFAIENWAKWEKLSFGRARPQIADERRRPIYTISPKYL
jgi:hypothetical protein